MQTKPVSIDVTKELSDFIIPLGQGEFQQLEQNIIEEGCRDPLIVWENGNKNILVDGHNRYKICKKHGVAFKTKKMSFSANLSTKRPLIFFKAIFKISLIASLLNGE